jgi:hypothetical protein
MDRSDIEKRGIRELRELHERNLFFAQFAQFADKEVFFGEDLGPSLMSCKLPVGGTFHPGEHWSDRDDHEPQIRQSEPADGPAIRGVRAIRG